MKSAIDFKHIQCDGYQNINSIAEITNRLHISETLFGDHNAKIMILGQDGANFEKIRKLVEIKGANGYRHGESVKTNVNLQKCLNSYFEQELGSFKDIPAETCGVYFANAIWLLKETSGMSSSLKNQKQVLNVSTEVLDATINGLPNLELIITLGKPAYDFLKSIASNLNIDWHQMKDSHMIAETKLFSKNVKIAAVLHPSPLSGGKNILNLKNDFDVILKKSKLLK